ncbi:MAG: hypothetical protein JXL84_05010 [Deltaproteobacteria bacterium]|nr:hypothetical protein [Deltaproteobacteria bacterium]
MARIIHCHPSRTDYDYHVYTDLDFWDTRKILGDLAVVKRNFGEQPPGDEFPTQVVGNGLRRSIRAQIEKRLGKAIPSPPRHVLVRAILMNEFFEFDPVRYCPARWSPVRMMHFTLSRIPLQQSGLNSPFRKLVVQWVGGKIRMERVPRDTKYDPPIASRKEALRRLNVPSCF